MSHADDGSGTPQKIGDVLTNHHQANPNHTATVRLGLVQHSCGPAPEVNFAKTVRMIREAASAGAQVIATQELFSTLYFPQTEDAAHFQLAQPIPGPTTQRLCGLAHELNVEIVASFFEQRAQGLYHNTAVVVSPSGGGQILAVYRKMHIPDDPGFYEKFYFTPGDATCDQEPQAPGVEPRAKPSAWHAQQLRRVKAGLLVCWDQWFPEAARLTALSGAQLLLYPTAIGWASSETPDERARQQDAWVTVQRSHAITNGVFVAAINRVGVEGDLTFWGNSFVVDPGGRVIAQADGESEQVVIADCDLSLIDTHRQAWPFLRDRRVDAYHGLTQRYLDA